MSEPHFEVILKSSGGEVEWFIDPDKGVFFGRFTEREREIRRPLPRKTLHPCESTEISKRGMTEELNEREVEQASPRQSPPELCGVEGSNDDCEIQERMLALAEKLERGQEIKKLGMITHPSGTIEYTEIADVTTDNKTGVLHSNSISAKMGKCERSEEVVKCEPLKVCPKKESVDEENLSESFKSQVLTSVYNQRKTPSVEDLPKEMNGLFLAQNLLNPRSSARIVSDAPLKTLNGLGIKHRSTPIQKPTPLNKPITLKASGSKNVLPTASPVGMYIRSLPEPILIENVRSAQKKKQINSSPMTKPRSTSTATSSKENFLPPSDFVPVLPTVLHKAAGTMIVEGEIAPSTSIPGTGGKIGKLIDRGILPHRDETSRADSGCQRYCQLS